MDTIYWCKIFKAPALQQKHHIIGYEPLIGNTHKKFVHHMLLHECTIKDNENLQMWEIFSKSNGMPCYGDVPIEWDKCLAPVVAWAVGSKGENYPKHMGIPIGERKNSFYMLEVHFDNPEMKRAIDTTGFRLHYTNHIRRYDGGILVAGIMLSPLHVIPPLQSEYKSAGYCSTNCTDLVSTW